MDLPEDDDELEPPGELDARTAALQHTIATVVDRPCTCGAVLCGHGAVLAVVLGYKNRPLCSACLAAALREERAVLVERALQWIVRRDCFLHVWRRASEAEGEASADRPRCHFAGATPQVLAATATPTPAAATSRAPDATWDAGDLGCGELVLELRFRLRELPPGGALLVRATDPAAPVDLPAWCGLCGHTLLTADDPHYLIERKRT